MISAGDAPQYLGGVLVNTSEWLSLIQTITLISTGLVVLWYTWETAILRRAAQTQVQSQARQIEAQLEQIETQVRPFVILDPDQGRGTAFLENIGLGPALNVRVPEILVHERIEGQPVMLRVPTQVSVLRPGEKVSISVDSFVGGREFGDFFSAALHPKFTHDRLDVVIEYENIQLKSYRVVQTVEPQLLSITGFRPGGETQPA